MAASMWRMNGLWRRMAALLLLGALLLSNEVMCQDDLTTHPVAPSDANPTAAANADDVASDAPGAVPAGVSPTAGGQDSASGAPLNDLLNNLTAILNITLNGDNQGGVAPESTAAPAVGDNVVAAPVEVVDDAYVVKAVVPNVKCVGKEDIPESNAVKAVVATDNCEATKQIIEANAAGWCRSENCNLEIFQDGNTMLMASGDAKLGSLAEALQSESVKDKLGVTVTETPSSSGSSVFVGILVSGLLAALAITVGYFKCQRRSDAKGVRLADEAYPVDQENQGNTLVSVAPLNPPPETQEKPSVNGESPEAAKTQPPPPTNGHSTAKTADTEL